MIRSELHEGQVYLAVDIGRLFDVKTPNQLALRTRLVGYEASAQQFIGRIHDFVFSGANLNAARLAARPGMNLGLDDPLLTAEFHGPISGLLRAVSDATPGDWHAKIGQ
jgi:hypothetical protein